MDNFSVFVTHGSLILLLLVSTCKGQLTTTAFPMSAVQVRLMDGLNEREGRVEVYYRGSWGTICSDGWDVKDAAVVCRMLGYTGIARAVTGGVYPPGTGPIFLRGVDCAGNEQSIADCQYQGWLITVCNHTEDAGVICLGEVASTTRTTTIGTTPTTLPPKICNTTSTKVRLVNAANVEQLAIGRVQYNYNNSWRSVCNDRWGTNDAAVVCRMLCYNPANARAIIGANAFGNATEGFWLGNVVCRGNETDLADCSHSPWGQTTCNATETAGVSCLLDSPTPPPLPEPVVECTNEMITAKFFRSPDPLLKNEDLSVSGPDGNPLPNCASQTSNDTNFVIIAIPYIGCNTNRTMNDTHIIYSNIVRYAVPPPSDVITRTTIYYVPVSCVVNRTSNPNNDFDPYTRTPPPQAGGGKYNVQLLLFEDNRFTNPVADNPIRVLLGDWLYVGVQLYSTDPNLKVVLLDCYVAPSIQPDTRPQYYLIRNKCVVEPTVTLYPVNDTLFAFRFQSFEFIGNYSNSYMYLHANAYVCSVTETGGNCNRNCFNSTAIRRRRSSDGPYSIASQYVVIVMSDTKTSVSVTPSSTLGLTPITSGSTTTALTPMMSVSTTTPLTPMKSTQEVPTQTPMTSTEFHTSSPPTSNTPLRPIIATDGNGFARPTEHTQTEPLKSEREDISDANKCTSKTSSVILMTFLLVFGASILHHSIFQPTH